MTIEIISWSISTKVWDRVWIELATPGSAVRLASVARQGTHCAMRPGYIPCSDALKNLFFSNGRVFPLLMSLPRPHRALIKSETSSKDFFFNLKITTPWHYLHI